MIRANGKMEAAAVIPPCIAAQIAKHRIDWLP